MILLDTHALIWWVNGDSNRLSERAAAVIATQIERGKILVSSISAWEIAMLVARGRLSLVMDVAAWLSAVDAIDRVEFLPVDNEVAVKAVQLPGDFHKDPADRIIVATARKWNAPIVSADEKIGGYRHVKTIW